MMSESEILKWIIDRFAIKTIKRILAKISKQIVENEKRFLEINVREIEIYQSDDELPSFGYLHINIENKGDINFEIKRLYVSIDVSAENILSNKFNRLWRTTYPLLRVSEDVKTMMITDNGIPIGSHIKLEGSPKIERKKTCNITVEFEIPHWVEGLRCMYIRGVIELQKGVVMEFEKTFHKSKIKLVSKEMNS